MMYEQVKAQLISRHMSKKELAKRMEIHYGTLLRKLRGDGKFTLDEALRIKEILHTEESIEHLFGTVE